MILKWTNSFRSTAIWRSDFTFVITFSSGTAPPSQYPQTKFPKTNKLPPKIHAKSSSSRCSFFTFFLHSSGLPEWGAGHLLTRLKWIRPSCPLHYITSGIPPLHLSRRVFFLTRRPSRPPHEGRFFSVYFHIMGWIFLAVWKGQRE